MSYGYYYYVSFIDDFSYYAWIYLMHARSDILHIHIDFINIVYTQFNKRVKLLIRCAREYLSSSMQIIFKSHGTLSQQFCPHTHEQNGVAERKHRHILVTIRALLMSTFIHH